MAVSKSELRARLRAARRSRSDAESRAVSAGLFAVLVASGLLDPLGRPGHVGAVRIAAYVAALGEPEVRPAREAVRLAGGQVLLPVARPMRTLAWAPDDGHYRPDPVLPVQSPTTQVLGVGPECLVAAGVVLVLAPALAVDASGTRLGQGGGFYDGLIAGLADAIPVMAVLHDDEVLPSGAIPREPHDAVVARALTPSGIVHLG